MSFAVHRAHRRISTFAILGFITVAMLAIAGLMSSVLNHWDMDRSLSHVWWHGPRQWFGDRSQVCWFLNEFGPLPGLLLAAGALVMLVVSMLRRRMQHLTPAALYILLAFLLGPGLLINGVLKHSWSRARPREVVEFGGKRPYERVFFHVEGSLGRSFPSGHASAAFILSTLGFAAALWGTRQGMWTGLLLGTLWGALVGWSRIASGAHFVSDVMWSAVLVTCVNFVTLLPFLITAKPMSKKPEMVESFA